MFLNSRVIATAVFGILLLGIFGCSKGKPLSIQSGGDGPVVIDYCTLNANTVTIGLENPLQQIIEEQPVAWKISVSPSAHCDGPFTVTDLQGSQSPFSGTFSTTVITTYQNPGQFEDKFIISAGNNLTFITSTGYFVVLAKTTPPPPPSALICNATVDQVLKSAQADANDRPSPNPEFTFVITPSEKSTLTGIEGLSGVLLSNSFAIESPSTALRIAVNQFGTQTITFKLASVADPTRTGMCTSIFSVDRLPAPPPPPPPAPEPRGLTMDKPAYGCKDVLAQGFTNSGAYWVTHPLLNSGLAFQAYCNQTLSGGGWAMIYNSVGGSNTTPFWKIAYADRFMKKGSPQLTSNFYYGSLYLPGFTPQATPVEFIDEIEDLSGKAVIAFKASATGIDPNTMRMIAPTRISGNYALFTGHFSGGWSSYDYDGDYHPDASCAQHYGDITQHYYACWYYNLGADGDLPYSDSNYGPHLYIQQANEIGLITDGTNYSRVRRITRYIHW